MACKGLDDQVAVPEDRELRDLLDQFVCVRIVQMHGVDLKRFAFDGSLTWATFMMNADGTIYGRYSSRSGLQKLSEREISLPGFKHALRGALELHERYRRDPVTVGAQLAGKTRADDPTWPTPEQIPTLESNARLNLPFVGENGAQRGCIHCHMAPTNELRSLRLEKRDAPDRLFFPYPMPDRVGFRMDPQAMARVERVWAGSAAARAGLRVDDAILRLGGQPILSTADIQWVLHNAGDEAVIDAVVARGAGAERSEESLKLELESGWRLQLADWRMINPRMLTLMLGFNVTAMPARRAQRLGLGGKLVLVVDRTTRELRKETGLGNRDIIIAVDGKREPMTVGAFTAYVFRNKPKGSTLTVRIMQISDRFPRPEFDVDVTVK